MFHNLGIQWAGTLLGCLATVMIPIPVVFWLYGDKIRSWSSANKSAGQDQGNDEGDGKGNDKEEV